MKILTGLEYTGGNISMPKGVWDEIEKLAAEWQVNKSAAIRRIIQEWKATRQQEETEIDSVASTEVNLKFVQLPVNAIAEPVY